MMNGNVTRSRLTPADIAALRRLAMHRQRVTPRHVAREWTTARITAALVIIDSALLVLVLTLLARG